MILNDEPLCKREMMCIQMECIKLHSKNTMSNNLSTDAYVL